MTLVYNILLFAVTIVGGLLPIFYKKWSEQKMHLLLSFSGAYLLSITMLHLIPEAAETLGFKMGAYMLAGFFLQQLLQRFTHGVEHGHSHIGHDHNSIPTVGLIFGMAIHAFAEGIPLGAVYVEQNTVPALYIAIALHKLPEAMLIASLLLYNKNNKTMAMTLLVLFAALSPISSLLTHYFGLKFEGIHKVLPYVIAVVTGSFLHIGTTIFYESGNKLHAISRKKWVLTAAAIGLALLSTLGDSHDHDHSGSDNNLIHQH